MSDFDWGAQEDAKPGFNWDDQEDVDKPMPITSAVRQGLQGLTANFSDELVGGGEALGRALGVEGAGGPMKDMGLAEDGPTIDWDVLKSAYKKARDHERERLKADTKYNPATSALAETAGAIASPINKVGKGLSMAQQAALLGGISSAGSSDADNAKDLLIDAGVGTGTGLALGKVTDKLSPIIEGGLQKASAGARNSAEWLAGHGLGGERGTMKKLGFDRVKAAGAQALDEGSLPILGSTEDMIAQNNAIRKRGGNMMGDAYKAIDDAGASTFNPLDVATEFEGKHAPTYRTPINKGETNQFDNTIESILSRGDGNIPMSEAQALKEEIGSVAFPGGKKPIDPTPKQQMAIDAYRLVNQKIDEAAAAGSSSIENAGLSDMLAKGKELYGNSKVAGKLLENKLAREKGNRFGSLTDWVAGSGALGYGEMSDDWRGAGGIMLAKKGLEKYGSKTAAHGMNAISKALMKSPTLAGVLSKAPQALGALSSKISDKISPMLRDQEKKPDFDKDAVIEKVNGTKYAQVLQDAAKRGDQAFGATHFILQSTDPQYREALERNGLDSQ